MVLRMMAEEVTQYRDDLEADNKRNLLSALTGIVPRVLPFLETSMEGHFGQAMAASQQGQHQLSQLHAAVVTAALSESCPAVVNIFAGVYLHCVDTHGGHTVTACLIGSTYIAARAAVSQTCRCLKFANYST